MKEREPQTEKATALSSVGAQRWMVVVGTRPEVIKMAPVYRAIEARQDVEAVLVSSGQHRDLLDRALADFDLVPAHDLQVMQPNQDLAGLATRVLAGMSGWIQENRPDAVVVQGDTTTAFAAALAAFYAGIPVYHVEAGLRSHRLDAPFPEEANRVLIGQLARHHFAPTQAARDNLLREGVAPAQVDVTGNTVIDALLWMRARCQATIPGDAAPLAHVVQALDKGRRCVLVTAHRRENFGAGVDQFCDAIKTLATQFPEIEIVFPVHPNPNIAQPIHAQLGGVANIHLLAPLGYGQFVWLLDRCHMVITDSGGVQEEAATLGKPLIVTREVTERSEAITQGGALLAGASSQEILAHATRLLMDASAYRQMAVPSQAYGDGAASARIVARIADCQKLCSTVEAA